MSTDIENGERLDPGEAARVLEEDKAARMKRYVELISEAGRETKCHLKIGLMIEDDGKVTPQIIPVAD